MQVESSGESEVAALGERGHHKTGQAAQVLIAIGKRSKALLQLTGAFLIEPVVAQISVRLKKDKVFDVHV